MGDEKIYTRDKRSPIPANRSVSKIMSSIKSKNTKPEIILRKILWKYNLKGFRIHPQKIPGKPDICYISRKIAIFVNGCFWHSCPNCNKKIPKHNSRFWEDKFKNNKARDIDINTILKSEGWLVITIWECQLKKAIIETTSRNIFDLIGIQK